MIPIAPQLAESFGHLATEPAPTMPEAEFVWAPPTAEEAAAVLDAACEHGLSVLLWGAGHHQGYGNRVDPDVVLSTAELNRVVGWSPDDLTLIVESGVRLSHLAEQLVEGSQTAVLPEGDGTVGGAVAAARTGWGRLRYGPIRDRVLEVVLATGDGRVVRGGAPLVKNVTGYDLPRLVTGSFGSLGLITRVALKLWPTGARAAIVEVADAERALAVAYRPLAVIEENGRARVYLSGTAAEVESQLKALGGTGEDRLAWPNPLSGDTLLVMRVPPGSTRDAIREIPAGWDYQASLGVGEIRISGNSSTTAALAALRQWAGARGGSVVIERAPAAAYEQIDPWGDPGASLPLQRRVKAAFDPMRICNPGRLPGGL